MGLRQEYIDMMKPDPVTVTIERETLERALAFLQRYENHPDIESGTVAALRAALAAQPAEPVAEVHPNHLRPHDETGGHWCREVLLYSGNSPHDWLDGKNTRVKLYAAQPAPAAVPPGYVLVPGSGAAHDVLAERQRQMSAEGWTPEHDDEHNGGELAEVASLYAMRTEFHKLRTQTDARSSGRGLADPDDVITRQVPIRWPESWACWWWKPKDRRSNLVRAAALLIAEIERLDRSMIAAAGDKT